MPAAGAALRAGHHRDHGAVRVDQHRGYHRRPAAAGRRRRPQPSARFRPPRRIARPVAAGLTGENHHILTHAAGHGHIEAVRLMLDLGFPPGTRSGHDDGATALHLAAAAGSTGTVRLLLDHGADIEAGDTSWDSTPLEW